MRRHACSYKHANDGHDARAIQSYLDHRSINSTVLYTQLASGSFKGFWRDTLIRVLGRRLLPWSLALSK
jgi:site-specific recombinase XerD